MSTDIDPRIQVELESGEILLWQTRPRLMGLLTIANRQSPIAGREERQPVGIRAARHAARPVAAVQQVGAAFARERVVAIRAEQAVVQVVAGAAEERRHVESGPSTDRSRTARFEAVAGDLGTKRREDRHTGGEYLLPQCAPPAGLRA